MVVTVAPQYNGVMSAATEKYRTDSPTPRQRGPLEDVVSLNRTG